MFPITCQAFLNNVLSYVPCFTSRSVVSPRNSVPLKSVLKKKCTSEDGPTCSLVALLGKWIKVWRVRRSLSFKLNKTVENKFLHDTNSSTGNLFQVWKRTWKQKRKKMTFSKHVRVNGSMHAISFSTNNSITNFYPSPYWGLVGAQLIITGSWVVSWVGKGFSFVLISKSTIR